MELIKREDVEIKRGGPKLHYDKLTAAIKKQTLDKDHVLAVSSQELDKILGTKKEKKSAKATLARALRKKVGLHCVYDAAGDRYIFSVEE